MTIHGIFYARFLPQEGTKIVAQSPPGCIVPVAVADESDDDFDPQYHDGDGETADDEQDDAATQVRASSDGGSRRSRGSSDTGSEDDGGDDDDDDSIVGSMTASTTGSIVDHRRRRRRGRRADGNERGADEDDDDDDDDEEEEEEEEEEEDEDKVEADATAAASALLGGSRGDQGNKGATPASASAPAPARAPPPVPPGRRARGKPLFDFDVMQEYVIPRPAFFNRYLAAQEPSGRYAVLGCPVAIRDAKYDRNEFIFNFGVVVDVHDDQGPYERVVRRLASTFAEMEKQNEFLSREEQREQRLSASGVGIGVGVNVGVGGVGMNSLGSLSGARGPSSSLYGGGVGMGSPGVGGGIGGGSGGLADIISMGSGSHTGTSGLSTNTGSGSPAVVAGGYTGSSSSGPGPSLGSGSGTSSGTPVFHAMAGAVSIGGGNGNGSGNGNGAIGGFLDRRRLPPGQSPLLGPVQQQQQPPPPPAGTNNTAVPLASSAATSATVPMAAGDQHGHSPYHRRSIQSLLEIIKEDLNLYGECMIPVDDANTINMKLFPLHPNPPAVEGWHVPVPKMRLADTVDPTWDLTLQRVIAHMDGVSDVRRIAFEADISIELCRAALRHLLYYDTILLLDIFFFGSCYAPRPGIHDFVANVGGIVDECARYVCLGQRDDQTSGGGGDGSGRSASGSGGEHGGTSATATRQGGGARQHGRHAAMAADAPLSDEEEEEEDDDDGNDEDASTSQGEPSSGNDGRPTTASDRRPVRVSNFDLIRLMTSFCVGRTVTEWLKGHADAGFDVLRYVDVRRLVQFGVIKGCLYRVHKYVVSKQYLASLVTGRSTPGHGHGHGHGHRHHGDHGHSSQSSVSHSYNTHDTHNAYNVYNNHDCGHRHPGSGDVEAETDADADADPLQCYTDGQHHFDQIITEQNITEVELIERLKRLPLPAGDLKILYR